jgi:hypothetical protein
VLAALAKAVLLLPHPQVLPQKVAGAQCLPSLQSWPEHRPTNSSKRDGSDELSQYSQQLSHRCLKETSYRTNNI